MAEFNLPFGVRIANNDPIDYDRYVAADIAERDLLVSEGRAYNGLQVYVESEEKIYLLTDVSGPIWEEIGADLDASINDLYNTKLDKSAFDASIGEYVEKSGDTMTGPLEIDASLYVDNIREYSSNTGVDIDGILHVQGWNTLIEMSSSVRPNANAVWNLGGVSNRWNQVYATSFSLGSGAAVSDIQTILTNDDTKIPTSGAVYTEISILDTSLGTKLDKSGGTITGDLAIDNDLDIGGNLTVNGSTYIIGTETIDVSSAYIQMNTGLTGSPPTTMQSGVIVNRGDEDPYAILYDETNEQFRIGITNWNGTQYEDASTQAAATREDSPAPDGIPYWNDVEKRFDTSSGITIDILSGSTGYIPTYGSPLSQSTLSFSGGILKNNIAEDFIIESTPAPGTTLLKNLILRTPDASTNAGDVILKAGNVTTGTNRGNIVLVPGDQGLFGQGIIELSDNNSENIGINLVAQGSNANVGIVLTPKGLGMTLISSRVVIGYGSIWDFQYSSIYHDITIDADKPARILMGSTTSGVDANELIIKGGTSIDASFGGDLILEAGLAGNTGVGGTLILRAGISSGTAVDGSIFMENIGEVSTNKVLYYNDVNGDVTYGDAPAGGGGVTQAYVDGSLAIRDASIERIDVSLNNTINAFDLFYEKNYIDGSLALRDSSIDWLYTNKLGIDASLSDLSDISVGAIGSAQDGSALVYNAAGEYWEYGTSGSGGGETTKTLLVDYGSGSNVTFDLGRDTRSKYVVNATDASLLIDDASLSSLYSYTMVLDITGSTSTLYSLHWDPSLSTDNWVDGDVLSQIDNTSVYTVTMNTNGNSYEDILINYIKKGI